MKQERAEAQGLTSSQLTNQLDIYLRDHQPAEPVAAKKPDASLPSLHGWWERTGANTNIF